MKIKTLSRSLDSHAPASIGAPAPVSRNLDPSLHPFSQAREYTRALNAVKVERMFAKPFVAALEGHGDGVYVVEMDPERGNIVASGAGDGEIRLWNLPTRSLLQSIPRAHDSVIQSLCISPLTFSPSPSGLGTKRLLSCGTDRTIKLWDANPDNGRMEVPEEGNDEDGTLGWLKEKEVDRTEPLLTWHSKTSFNSLTHHASSPIFASSSNVIQLWDLSRGQSSSSSSSTSAALQTLKWGSTTSDEAEAINVVKYNQSEPELLLASGSSRSLNLYDTRSSSAIGGVKMKMRSNDLAWNPIEPTVFAVASEDQNIYTFDMRNLSSATQIYKDHVSAVMSVSYSPTGQELVSGGYDRTVRLWNVGRGNHSRDVYHAARMQRVFSTKFTLDARFVLTGSDDGNLRLWKSRASEKLGILSGKELKANEYRQALKKKYGGEGPGSSRNGGAGIGDIGKISRQRRVPKAIRSAQTLKREMLEAERVKEDRRRKHTRKGLEKPKAARKDMILGKRE
ncbi:WD40 repeat-like protein [Microstroma glucosiphilum]|uniref:DDB1- and CUL4-associated factor 13 n=1 Tax=Pseudomicrostroma glucosiphilum TaxID=1684307 RepID=A0A316U8W1_9BASI|nr:WD40 repeat-like protein [Pseudomicrostroma glucosiphilum]PWN20813.1 WD40 repeat-like protein [Pseudomicrostroma glucosiphilum]